MGEKKKRRLKFFLGIIIIILVSVFILLKFAPFIHVWMDRRYIQKYCYSCKEIDRAERHGCYRMEMNCDDYQKMVNDAILGRLELHPWSLLPEEQYSEVIKGDSIHWSLVNSYEIEEGTDKITDFYYFDYFLPFPHHAYIEKNLVVVDLGDKYVLYYWYHLAHC